MAIDWTKGMSQTFEFYEVDVNTWGNKRLINTITNSTIKRDLGSETLGSATFDGSEQLGEMYVRTYLIARQGNDMERVPLGTHIIQSPSIKYDGKTYTNSFDAYSSLLELKENKPSLGYSILKGTNIMNAASLLVKEHMRAPFTSVIGSKELDKTFTANSDDTWLSFLKDLIAKENYIFEVDAMGRVYYTPYKPIQSLTPIWTFNDDNSSILQPNIDWSRDLYGIPNVVEIIYTSNNSYVYSKCVNDDPTSPTSIQSRGREITYREMNPSFPGTPSQELLDEYAKKVLKDKSSIEYSVNFSHGYCPVSIGDCVILNYERSGLNNIRARIVSQSISCTTGCQVNEVATFTKSLYQ